MSLHAAKENGASTLPPISWLDLGPRFMGLAAPRPIGHHERTWHRDIDRDPRLSWGKACSNASRNRPNAIAHARRTRARMRAERCVLLVICQWPVYTHARAHAYRQATQGPLFSSTRSRPHPPILGLDRKLQLVEHPPVLRDRQERVGHDRARCCRGRNADAGERVVPAVGGSAGWRRVRG